MAIRTYRYRQDGVTGNDDLQSEVHPSATFNGSGNKTFVDVDCEESVVEDLHSFMEDHGYTHTKADPIASLEDEGATLQESQHKAFRQLAHFVDHGPGDGFASGSFQELTYSGVFVTSDNWYDDNTKTKKLVTLDITYSGVTPTTEVWKIYDTDGSTVLVTLTDTIVYSGVFEQSRTRTWA